MSDDAAPRFAPDDVSPPKPADGKGGKAVSAGGGGWRTDSANAQRSQKTVAAVTLFVLLAVVGIIVGMIIWLESPPEPYFVSVPLSEYDHHGWPINPWAVQDAELLMARFPKTNDREAAALTFASQQKNKFQELLKWVQGDTGTVEGGPIFAAKDRPLILHITALSITREDKVYLIPGDATPHDPQTWIPLEDILNAFEKSLAPQKLLLLDLGHSTSDLFSGTLMDDPTAVLHALLTTRQKENHLPFPVLTSCGPGEESLPADPEKCSIFAFYVSQALQGWADGYEEGKVVSKNMDQQLTISELAKFTTLRVSRYARVVYDRRQTPTLYGDPKKGPTFLLSKKRPEPTELPAPPVPYYPRLLEEWKTRDQQLKNNAIHGMPDALAQLTAGLTRAEQIWLRTDNAVRTDSALGNARNAWKNALPSSGQANPAAEILEKALQSVKQYRLAVARKGRPAPNPELATALDQLLAARIAAAAGKPDESAKFKEALQMKIGPNEEIRRDVAWLVWERAVGAKLPNQERFAIWSDVIDQLGLEKTFSEMLLLRTLAQWDFRGQGISEYPTEEVHALLQAEHELSLLLAVEPNGFELIANSIKTAEDSRQQGQSLLTGRFEMVKQASAQLIKAANGFRDVRNALTRWQEGNQKYESCVALLLDLLPAAMNAEREVFETWQEAVLDTTTIAEILAPSGQNRALDAGAVTAAISKLDRAMNKVREKIPTTAEKSLLEPPSPRKEPGESFALRQLIAGPVLAPDLRQKIVDALRADLARFHESVRKQDDADDTAGSMTVNPSAALESGRISEANLAVRRAKVSLMLLKLAGAQKTREIEPKILKFESDPSLKNAGDTGDRLRTEWLKNLQEQKQKASAVNRWHEVDRIARVSLPGLMEQLPRSEKKTVDSPTVMQATASVRAYKIAARDSFAADAKHPYRSKTPGAEGFYQSAPLDLSPD